MLNASPVSSCRPTSGLLRGDEEGRLYQTLTADRLRRHFGFSDDYRVDAVLASGTWDLLAETHHIPHLVNALTDLGLGDLAAGKGPGGLRPIEIPQFGHAREFTDDGRRFWFVR